MENLQMFTKEKVAKLWTNIGAFWMEKALKVVKSWYRKNGFSHIRINWCRDIVLGGKKNLESDDEKFPSLQARIKFH